MSELLGMTHWTWVAIGLALIGIEMLAPVSYFLWLGVSALVTAAVVFLFPDMGWQAQLLLYSALAVISVVITRRYLVHRQVDSEVPNLNRRAQQYVGRVFTLSEAIRHGQGKIKVDDTHWKVTGPNLEAGTEVRITSASGSVFEVEATGN